MTHLTKAGAQAVAIDAVLAKQFGPPPCINRFDAVQDILNDFDLAQEKTFGRVSRVGVYVSFPVALIKSDDPDVHVNVNAAARDLVDVSSALSGFGQKNAVCVFDRKVPVSSSSSNEMPLVVIELPKDSSVDVTLSGQNGRLFSNASLWTAFLSLKDHACAEISAENLVVRTGSFAHAKASCTGGATDITLGSEETPDDFSRVDVSGPFSIVRVSVVGAGHVETRGRIGSPEQPGCFILVATPTAKTSTVAHYGSRYGDVSIKDPNGKVSLTLG